MAPTWVPGMDEYANAFLLFFDLTSKRLQEAPKRPQEAILDGYVSDFLSIFIDTLMICAFIFRLEKSKSRTC